MLTVDRESWHARVYRWWYHQKYGATCYDYSKPWDDYRPPTKPNDPVRTNLCPYMRAVMFWSWMRFLFLGGKIWKLPIPAVTWLFLVVEVPRWLGIISYPTKMLILMIYAVVGVIALTIAIIWGINHLQSELGFFDTVILPAKKAKQSTASFFELIHEYLRSAHDRVCPEVDLKGGR